MRYLTLAALVLSATPTLAGDTHVDGHFRKDGTYVQPHYRTAPDSNRLNNYGTQGNTNPHTGQAGTQNPYAPQNPYSNNLRYR